MLTGRTRYRIGFRKKLVMQVEYWGAVSRGGWLLPRQGQQWRDATIEDMQAIERGEVSNDSPSLAPPPPPRPHVPQPRPVR